MRNFKNSILFTVLLSLASYPSFAGDTTVYPPTNHAAGGGLLYFPAGGNSSLYAVPVLSDDLTAAVKAQTKALEEQTEAVKDQTTAISEVKDLIKKTSSIQCSAFSYNVMNPLVVCVNVATGAISTATPNYHSFITLP